MKNSKTINVLKNASLIGLLGLSLAFCNKNDSKDVNPDSEAADYHQTASTQFVNAGTTNFAYRVLGNKTGIPLVMISALGNSMDDWDPAITNGLAQQRKVILFDIQGVGSSSGNTPENIADMAKGVVSFIKALGYSKVDLLGFSMGSFISQQVVLTEPALVNKVILTGTGPKGAEGLSNLPNLLGAAAGLSQEEFLLKFAFASSPASIEAGKLSYQRILKRKDNRDAPATQESVTAQVKAVMGWAQPYPDALKELKKITQPVLIAQGEYDLPVPVINAVNISRNVPNAQLIIYPDAGHAAVFQYPEKFVQSALVFLGK
jgi:pimeloyl-ACP methyl ester carboxylesterase